jgi:cytochrome c
MKEKRMVLPLVTSERDEVKQWVKRAVAFCQTAGKEISLAELMNPRGHFVQNHLYVFALDLDGIMLAHPINDRFVGKNFLDIKDSDGKSFIREMVTNAKSAGHGFADYKWYHPTSKDELRKTVYFEKTDDMIICGGFYNSKEDCPEDFFEYMQYFGTFG